MNTFIQQGHIKLVKSDIKVIYNFTFPLWTVILNCNNISDYKHFYCIFYQTNAALVSITFFLNVPIPNFWMVRYSFSKNAFYLA